MTWELFIGDRGSIREAIRSLRRGWSLCNFRACDATCGLIGLGDEIIYRHTTWKLY